MKNDFIIEMPLFPGFYDSLLLNESIENNCIESDFSGVDYDDIDIDYHQYEIDCCVSYTEQIKERFDKLYPNFIKSIEFEGVTYPKEYNFRTNQLYAHTTFSENWLDTIKKFMSDNKDTLYNWIDRDWSSRDGFMSFMSSWYHEWELEFEKDEPDERYIMAMMSYMLLITDRNIRYSICKDVLEDVSLSSYMKLKDKDTEQ